MPIRPENKHRYPADWNDIRYEVLERAGHKCEFCGVKNHAEGVRDEEGTFHEVGTSGAAYVYDTAKDFKPIRIVLTIAHLDHTPENNKRDNLKALCQRCHNKYDMPHRIANRRKNKQLEIGE